MNDRPLPMLAVRGQPFDSPEFLFEVKWNGVRALAAHEAGGWWLWGRERADYTARYPELHVLSRLPSGTLVDGELILVPRGLPDLDALLARHQLANPLKIRQAGQRQPVTYVLFDLLWCRGRSLLREPLRVRRALLQELVQTVHEPRLLFSEGVSGTGRGTGRAFFEQATQQGQEGIMAKHLASRYVPGRRSAAWRKIKPVCSMPCVIIGWLPGRHGLRRLLVAAPWHGRLHFVASLLAGFTSQVRVQLQDLLAGLTRSHPVVPCSYKARWVEPSLYCRVRFLEWTPAGRLRGASFQGLLSGTPTPP